ncbi:MAG: B12-binding domain-containing radical SAM protein [Thermodesulfobacteriota bacterium]
MNIVLATAPDEDSPWNEGSFPPLGLLYVATSVKNLPGVEVKVIDTYCEGLNMDQSVERILSCSPDLLGVTVTSKNFREARKLTAGVKAARPDTRTIFGGIHPTIFDTLLLKEIPALDFVFRGEGEEGFPELCRRLLEGRDLAGVPGISYRNNGEVVRGEIQRIQNLDSLPMPDRSLLADTSYGTQWYGFNFPGLPPLATASSSRGCPYHCVFCSCTKMFGDRLRTRSAENVFQELLQLANAGFEAVIFFDDNFTGDVERVNRLCRLILEHDLKMYLACAGVLHKVPDDTLKLMHRAGFDVIFVGVESGSDAQLRRYKKPTTSRKLAEDILRAKKANIVVIASFITGYAGETAADHEASKEFVRKVKPQFAEINPLMVYPGSGLWDTINGPEAPESLEKTSSRLISRFPGQLDKATIKVREQEFRRTFQKTWRGGGRGLEILKLAFNNKTVRLFMKGLLRNPKFFIQLLFGGNPRN